MVAEGDRIVLETEHWAITLDVNGVSKEPKASLHERPGEWLRDGVTTIDPEDAPYIELETTLFVGEILDRVSKKDGIFLCAFRDFTCKLIPCRPNAGKKPPCDAASWAYYAVLGCDRHLKRKCDCGGDGEILRDFVDDYIVRCKSCGRSTWADSELQTAINDWNDGLLPIKTNTC